MKKNPRTPETNAAAFCVRMHPFKVEYASVVRAEFAAALEQERNKLRTKLNRLSKNL